MMTKVQRGSSSASQRANFCGRSTALLDERSRPKKLKAEYVVKLFITMLQLY